MTLINTPFQDDGIYYNGIYDGLPDCWYAITPTLCNFGFQSFSILAKFKIDEYPAANRPVLWAEIITGGSVSV